MQPQEPLLKRGMTAPSRRLHLGWRKAVQSGDLMGTSLSSSREDWHRACFLGRPASRSFVVGLLDRNSCTECTIVSRTLERCSGLWNERVARSWTGPPVKPFQDWGGRKLSGWCWSTAGVILLSEELLGQNRVWDLAGWDGQFQSPEFIAFKYNEPSRGTWELARRSSLMVWLLIPRLSC